MSRRLYLDLDGVMADFDGTFPAVFGLDHRDMADDEMWAKINSHPSFFRDLPPMAGAIEFFRTIEHLHPIILTACPKSNYAHVATQKVEWVRAHLSETVTVLPVQGGASKPLFMHAKGDILIDDYRRNTEAWAAAGGTAILHRSWDVTRRELYSELGWLLSRAEAPDRGVSRLSKVLFELMLDAERHIADGNPKQFVGAEASEIASMVDDVFGRYDAVSMDYEGLLADHEALIGAPVLPTPLTGKYGEVLRPFVEMIEHELHANAGKGDRPGWLTMDRKTALLEIFYHLSKLQKAAKDDDRAGIREYAADVANMAMMMVDVCGALETVTEESPA